MTPLAHKISKEMTLPLKRRTFADECGLMRRVPGAHCFELTEVYFVAYNLACDVIKIAGGPITTFLPAPKTWIEYRFPNNGNRTGWLIEENILKPGVVKVSMATDDPGQNWFGTWGDVSEFALADGRGVNREINGVTTDRYYDEGFSPENLIPAFLLLINSPRVIGRRQHMPHVGLEKKLIASKAISGKFPLHAWTEIKLEVNPGPQYWGDDSIAEAHLTGKRALHFCRSHLRVKLGRLEVVRSHWRGDASIGIKQSRYKLVNNLAHERGPGT